jgi:hypothetical protein
MKESLEPLTEPSYIFVRPVRDPFVFPSWQETAVILEYPASDPPGSLRFPAGSAAARIHSESRRTRSAKPRTKYLSTLPRSLEAIS